jgi:hypothetical protein
MHRLITAREIEQAFTLAGISLSRSPGTTNLNGGFFAHGRSFSLSINLFSNEKLAIALYRGLLQPTRRSGWHERRIANVDFRVEPPGLSSRPVKMPARVRAALRRLSRGRR